MALVKTLAQHQNTYGETFIKKKGVVYDHPAPGPAIDAGFVKPHTEKKSPAE